MSLSVYEAAARLFDLLAASSSNFTRHFVQGLTEAEIASLTKFHQTELPAEAASFYQHYNLPSGYQNRDGRPRLFGDYYLLGLQQLLISKNSVSELAAEFFPDEPGSAQWMPFLQSEAGYYLLDGAGAANTEESSTCPVLFMLSGSDPELRFVSLAGMFNTMADWAAEGIVPLERGGLTNTDKALRAKLAGVALRYNASVPFWQDMAG